LLLFVLPLMVNKVVYIYNVCQDSPTTDYWDVGHVW